MTSIVWSLLCYCVRNRDHCCVLCDVARDLVLTWYIVHQPVYVSCRTSEQPRGFINGVKCTSEANSGTTPDAKVRSSYFYENLAFLRKWRFFVKFCAVLANALPFNSFSLFLHTWVRSLPNFIYLFSAIVSKTGGDQKDSSSEDEHKVKNIILEFT